MTLQIGKGHKIVVTGPATPGDNLAHINKANMYVLAKPIAARVINKMNTYIVVGPPPINDTKKRRTMSVWMG